MMILSRVACRIFILVVSTFFICVSAEALGGQGIGAARIRRVAIDPSDSDVVYAASNRGIFKSTDAGQSWFEINEGLPPHPDPSELDPSFFDTLDVSAFAIDPSTPQTIYTGILPTLVRLRDGRFIEVPGGFFKSLDGGSQWFAPTDHFTAYGVVVDPGVPDTIYAAAIDFWKTTDGGVNWLRTRLPATPAMEIALAPSDSNTIYLGVEGGSDTTRNGILKSVNGGEDWFESDEGFPRAVLQYSPTLAIDPQNPDIGYASVFMYSPSAGTYQTIDGGQTWSQVDGLGRYGIAIDPKDTNTIYVGDIDGVAKSTDRGATWFVYRDGLGQDFTIVHELAIDPQDSQILYAATENATGGGVFKSIDGGESWFATAAP
jgi:photosystem II stability/assembly factor-like uncharacterized protein